MNRVTGPPLLQFLQCPAAVFEELFVDGFDVTDRRQGCDQAGNTIYNQAHVALAFAHGFFCPSALRNLLFQLFIGGGKF